MTRQRMDDKSTEFGLWVRGQLPNQVTDVRCISSKPGQGAMLIKTVCEPSPGIDAENLDYIWFAYRKGKLMLLEEKRHGHSQKWQQAQTHSIVDEALQYTCDSGYLFTQGRLAGWDDGLPQFKPAKLEYHGYHVITFGKTHPEDGWTKIDGTEVTIEQLLNFLGFEWKVNDATK